MNPVGNNQLPGRPNRRVPCGNITGGNERYAPGNRQDGQRNPQSLGRHAEGFGAHLRDRFTVCYRPRTGQRNLPTWESADDTAHPRNKAGADAPIDSSERRISPWQGLWMSILNSATTWQ